MIRSDYRKYKRYGGNFIGIVFLTQAFWAIIQFRVASFVYNEVKIFGVRHLLLGICLIWQKLIEVTTGISLPASVIIGRSFYIGHFGNIFIHPNCCIGNNCNISQGVTIGISGRGVERGVPTLGDNVYVGCNSTIVGKIVIGDNCVIGANSLVNRSVIENQTVLGVPAQVISSKNSSEYI
tara:strand:+ start:405 stop:944 length:540 start_codon:yes stop_codon:yes gene_type:complete